MRNARAKLRKHSGSCCWIFGVVYLLIITITGNLRIWRISPNAECFHDPQTQSARRIDYILSMEKIAKDRSIKYPPNITYKWLFLTTFGIYRQVMDRHFFSIYYAAKRHPNINATLWGRDFSGYDASKLIIENIRDRYGSFGYFDIIFQVDSMYAMTDVRSASQYTPMMYRDHECWGYRCLPGLIDLNISIYLQTFAYEMDLYHTAFSYNRVIAHSPASAEPLMFYPPMALNSDTSPVRDIDVLVVGARDRFVYPIRTRMGELVKKGLIKNGHVFSHPGYVFWNNSVEQTEAQLHAYAALLRRAKIVVSDSSRYGYALGKYSEVPLSGCLVLGDIPAEREEEFRSYIVEISMKMTDDQLLQTIHYWITHDSEREARARRGQYIVLHSYTWDHAIDVALDAALKYRKKQFGLFHKYPYSMKCTPIDNTLVHQSMLTKWCSTGVKGMPLRSLCECNQTHVNYLKEEPDVDNWLTIGLDADPKNSRLFLVPTSFLVSCVGQKTAELYAREAPSGSVCRCPHVNGPRRASDMCYVSNSALSISRHFVYLDGLGRKMVSCQKRPMSSKEKHLNG